MVAAAAQPVGGVARPALDKPPAPVSRFLFPLFYLVEIRHRQLFDRDLAPADGCHVRKSYNANMVIIRLSICQAPLQVRARHTMTEPP